MADVEKYRQIIQDILRSYVYEYEGGEVQMLFDKERDHYQIMHVGWRETFYREYGIIMHMDIKDGKIWVQWNGTEDDVALELVARGVPKSDIVLGMQAPYKRPYTEYGVG